MFDKITNKTMGWDHVIITLQLYIIILNLNKYIKNFQTWEINKVQKLYKKDNIWKYQALKILKIYILIDR